MGKTDPHIYEIKACLKILGFDGPPNVITKILGTAPTRVWLKGDKVPKTILEYEQNGWLFKAPVDELSTDTERATVALLDSLPDPSRFRQLPRSDIEISYAIYGYKERPYFNLSAATIARIAAIGADIDVDIYDMTSLTSSEAP